MLPIIERSVSAGPTSTVAWGIQARLDQLDQHRLNQVTRNVPPRFQVHFIEVVLTFVSQLRQL